MLLGDPIAHSLSATIHNAAFQALDLDLVYLACRVRAEHLATAVEGLRALGAAGANVTVPHKTAVNDLAATLTPEARATGAVNTLVPVADGWLGANTDVAGFLAGLGALRDEVAGARVLIFGSGGAARAAAYATLTRLEPASVLVASRIPARAQALVDDLGAFDSSGVLTVCPPESVTDAIDEASLVVNATPLGMPPFGAGSPLPAGARLEPEQIVYDLVYGAPTPLVRQANAAGARVIDGMDMLLAQGAESFRLWTGREMPLETVRAALGSSNQPT